MEDAPFAPLDKLKRAHLALHLDCGFLPAASGLLVLFLRRLRLILVWRLLPLLHLLLLLRVALLGLLGLLLVALFDLLPSGVIGILLRQTLVFLLLFLLEPLVLVFLFGVELVLLLLVFPVPVRITRVWRSRPVVRRNFLGMTVRRTIGSDSGIATRAGRSIGSSS